MATVNEKMTALADEIRTLSGDEGKLGLDAMATHVGDANTEINGQAQLLAQISAALEGKMAGGGSGDWIYLDNLPSAYIVVPSTPKVYIQITDNVIGFVLYDTYKCDFAVRDNTKNCFSVLDSWVSFGGQPSIIKDEESGDTYVEFSATYNEFLTYVLPIHSPA